MAPGCLLLCRPRPPASCSWELHLAARLALHPLPALCPSHRSEVYALWSERLNWPEWFGMIEELGFSEQTEDVVALNMWYRWGEQGLMAVGQAAGRGRWVAHTFSAGWQPR